MKILPLGINNFGKKLTNSEHRLIHHKCEDNKDLYDDEDFLQILNMSSDDVKAEIRSYNEDPDEVLARIKGRLDNVVIPLKIKKPKDQKINNENIFHLLFNLVNKKITSDAFTKSKKNKISFKDRLKNSYLTTVIPTAVISIFSTVIVLESDVLYSSESRENNAITFMAKKSEQDKSINKIISKYSNNPIFMDKFNGKTYFSHLIGIHPKEITPVNKKNNIKETKNYFVWSRYMDNKNITGKNELLSLIGVKNYQYNRNTTKEIISLKKNDSIYSLSKRKKHGFKINSHLAINKLPPLINGNKIQLTLKDKTLIKVGYIDKNGIMSVIALNGDNIEKPDVQAYYTKDVFHIYGNITKGQNIYTIVRNSKEFKNGKNREIANTIAAKFAQYIIDKKKAVIFNHMLAKSRYDFSISIGIDPKTNQIASVGAVKKALIRYDIASTNDYHNP